VKTLCYGSSDGGNTLFNTEQHLCTFVCCLCQTVLYAPLRRWETACLC
jgi:hypothetical protein